MVLSEIGRSVVDICNEVHTIQAYLGLELHVLVGLLFMSGRAQGGGLTKRYYTRQS